MGREYSSKWLFARNLSSYLSGRVRKELKIRPGFTPQEDVKRFQTTKQAQMEANALPKGHVIGWTPPTANEVVVVQGMTQAQRKNAKRKEKRKEKRDEEGSAPAKVEKVKDSWEDEDEDEQPAKSAPGTKKKAEVSSEPKSTDKDADALTDEIAKLKVQ